MRAGPNLRRRATPLLLLLALSGLGLAWIFANPPGAAPDETSHYLKAIGVGGGDLAGRAPRREVPSPTEVDYEALARLLRIKQGLEGPAFSQTVAGRWQRRSERVFTVPAGLGYSALACDLRHPERSARCLEKGERSTTTEDRGTFMGTYQPYLYVLPGLLARAVRQPFAAMRLGRLATALVSLALLAAAALLLWDRGRGALALTGLMVAVTPSVLFFASTLSTSGPEICGAICFTAALIRLSRSAASPGWVWLLAAAGGAVLALSRSLGPLFIVLLLIGSAAFSRPSQLWARLRGDRGPAVVATAIVLVAMAAGLIWQLKYQPSVGWNDARIREGVDPSIDSLGELAKQAVGKFGALDSDLPLGVYVVWWSLFAVLVGLALGVGNRRERLALAGLSLAVVAATVAISAVYLQTNFPLQARHVLPLAAVVPLWAGEIVNRHARALPLAVARRLAPGIALAAAAAHAVAWYANGRRFAVGVDGDWNYIPDAEWLPPLGWTPWVAVVLAAAAAYVAAGLAATRSPR